VGAGTILLPLSFIPFFLYSHKIKSVFMEESRERTIPLMVTLFAFFFTYMLLRYLPVSWLVKKYMLGATITVLFVFLINFRWKISAHMTGIGGLSGMIMVMILRYQMDFLFFFALSIFIAGITGTARLWLQSHKPSEVYSGYLLGLAIVSMVMIL
jgi:hypothetical protein